MEIEDIEEPVYFADGFDDAIVGLDRIHNKVIYSYSAMVECLMRNDKMPLDEAEEYIDYNFYGFNEEKVIICDSTMFEAI